ncbi:MAG: MATE family efflux transporter [Mediterranea sp.]|jgi:putative MATE family efflux protein|nr:MATE family efflux transporter [Mediterranea sp.]
MATQGIPTSLGTEKIGKLLMQYAVPAIIAMTASSLYNIIDSIFIGHGVGAMAISGLALSFPLMNLSAAFGSLVGVGASTLVSVKLGQKDYDTAQKVLGNVVLLNIILGVIFAVIALIFLDPILYFFGGSDNTVKYAREFMQVILLGNVVTHLYFGLNALLRASGHPQKSMYATIATVIINAVLAPIFIFVFDWGIRGAATATVIAQCCALLWQLRIFSDKKELLHFRRGIWKLHHKIVADSLAIGMAPFLMNAAACFIVILINQGLKRYGGDLSIGAYGIVNRLSFIFGMIVLGLNQGMQPIAGYNYGAQHYQRVTRVLKLTILFATGITTTGFLMAILIPKLVVSMFTTDAELIRLSVEGLRITLLCFPIVGFQMVTSNFFQSIGLANRAIFLSLTRQLLFLLPALLILPHFFEAKGVWYSMPLADLLASIVSGVMLITYYRKLRTKSDNPLSI